MSRLIGAEPRHSLHKGPETSLAIRIAELPQSLFFDLANPFFRDSEGFPNFFKSFCRLTINPEPGPQDLLFPWLQGR